MLLKKETQVQIDSSDFMLTPVTCRRIKRAQPASIFGTVAFFKKTLGIQSFIYDRFQNEILVCLCICS